MTAKTKFTPEQIIRARTTLVSMSLDVMLAKGYINIPAVLGDDFEYQVVLTDAGERKITVIKEIRRVASLGLAEAKVIADNCGVVLTTLSKAESDEAAKGLREQGASVTIKRVAR